MSQQPLLKETVVTEALRHTLKSELAARMPEEWRRLLRDALVEAIAAERKALVAQFDPGTEIQSPWFPDRP